MYDGAGGAASASPRLVRGETTERDGCGDGVCDTFCASGAKAESGGVFAGDGVDGEGGSFGDRYVRYADNRGNRSRVCGCIAR